MPSPRVKFVLGLAFIIVANPSEAREGNITSVSVEAKLEIDSGASVGVVGAGTMCLPRGVLHVYDFSSDDEELSSILREAIAELDVGQRGELSARYPNGFSIALAGMKTKLCARRWGVFGTGDTKSLTGRASFSFMWGPLSRPGEPRRVPLDITLEVPKNEGRTAHRILKDGVRLFLRQIIAR